ncbi:hypothetical protein [Polaromonas sp.]|uniref:hypothetical protein n=1 Tax=Polaromonas sp. TaxID=1869339 RepID=UPI00286A8C45|nr:hypothetical protein [Polaromonas sp.]
MTSTKIAPARPTYAQKKYSGAAIGSMWASARYQSHSSAKSLIYMDSLNCFFFGQINKSLDLRGFAAVGSKLSTKLSTENWEIFKTVSNQGLSALSECNFEEIPRTGDPK